MDQAPSYYALSYTWGTHTEKKEIFLDEESFLVQPNLESTLRQFRSRFWPFLIWADAVCINQDDNNERSQQVMLMEKISTNAIAVEAWLGEASQGSDQAMDLIRDTGRHVRSGKVTSRLLEWLRRPDHPWEALVSLLDRPWYERFSDFPSFCRKFSQIMACYPISSTSFNVHPGGEGSG